MAIDYLHLHTTQLFSSSSYSERNHQAHKQRSPEDQLQHLRYYPPLPFILCWPASSHFTVLPVYS